MLSKRQLIFAAVVPRLQLITIENEYQTDAGKNVFIGESVTLAEDDATHAIAVDILEDRIVRQESGPTPRISIRLPLSFQALVRADVEDNLLEAEKVLSDIKIAIETDSATWLGELAQEFTRESTLSIPRREGATAAGRAIDYSLLMFEIWGAP